MTTGESTRVSPAVTVPDVALPTDPGGSFLHRLWARACAAPLLTVVLAAMVSRLAAVIALGPMRPGVLIPDEQQYLDLAQYVASGRGAESWYPGYGQSLYDATGTFMRPLALLTWAFGSHQISGQLLAAAFGVLTAALTYRLASEVVTRGFAVAAGLVVALLPSQVLWSSVVLRESMVWAGLAILAVLLAAAGRARSSRQLVLYGVLGFAVMFGLAHLREQTAVVAAIALVLACLLFRAARPWPVRIGTIAVALLAPLAGGLGVGGYSLVENSLPQLATIRANLSLGANTSIVKEVPLPSAPPTFAPGNQPSGTGSVAPGATTGGPRGPEASSAPAVAGPPVRPDGSVIVVASDGKRFAAEGISLRSLTTGFVAVTVRPLPWDAATSSSMSLARIEALAWGPLYLLALVGLIAGWRHRRVLAFPVLVGGGILLLSAITQGNIGTAFRHRGQVLWVVALLAVVGVQRLRIRSTRSA